MLKLVELRIEGFRKFREAETFTFLSPSKEPLDYVVLSGPNGCGKTTVLEAIALVLGKDELLVRDLPPEERAKSSRTKLNPGATLTAKLLNANAEAQADTSFLVKRTAERHAIDENTIEAGSILHQLPVEYISSRRSPALVGAIEQISRGRPPAETEANRLWLLKHRILQQQGRRANSRYQGPEPLDKQWLDTLNAFWRKFRADGTEIGLDVVDQNNLDLTEWDLFLFRGKERLCPIDSLSSGELEVLALAAPFITSTQPFDGLLLFDEPELHMHPQWQGRILRALRSILPDAQMIVATHADDPWDDAMTWQRFLLVPPSDPRSEVWRKEQGEDA